MYSKDKLEYILDVLEEINWSIPELMKYTFTEPEKIKRSLRHAGVASKFLTGKDKVTPGQILQLWDKSADGRIADSMGVLLQGDTYRILFGALHV
jgi:hypothetical protein